MLIHPNKPYTNAFMIGNQTDKLHIKLHHYKANMKNQCYSTSELYKSQQGQILCKRQEIKVTAKVSLSMLFASKKFKAK